MLSLVGNYYATETGIRYLRLRSLVDCLSFVIEGYLLGPGPIGIYSGPPGTEIVAHAVVGSQPYPRPCRRIWLLRHELADWVDGTQTLTPEILSSWHPSRVKGTTSFLATDSAVDPLGIAAGARPSEPRSFVVDPAAIDAERRRSAIHRQAWSAWRTHHGVPEPTELTPYFYGAYARGIL